MYLFLLFSIWGNVLPFYPTNSPKMKIFLKRKKCLDTSSFNKSVPEIMIICFTVPEIWHMTDLIVIFHFGLLFALLPLAFFILNTILSFLSTSATKWQNFKMCHTTHRCIISVFQTFLQFSMQFFNHFNFYFCFSFLVLIFFTSVK